MTIKNVQRDLRTHHKVIFQSGRSFSMKVIWSCLNVRANLNHLISLLFPELIKLNDRPVFVSRKGRFLRPGADWHDCKLQSEIMATS